MKKILLIILAIMVCFCGCSINDESSSKSKEDLFVEKAEKHLKQKYPELEYTLGDVQFSGFMGDGEDTIEVSIENGKYKGKTFEIRRNTSDNPDEELTDDYFSYLIGDDYEKLVDKYAKKYFKSYQYSAYTSSYFENEFTSRCNFDDAKRSDKFIGNIEIIVKPTFASVKDFETAANKFIEDYKKENLKTGIEIQYVTPEIWNNIARYTHDNYYEYSYDVDSIPKRIYQNVNYDN